MNLRGIDYTQRITGAKLTDAAIERYALAGKYGPIAQAKAKASYLQRKQKPTSTSTTKCASARQQIRECTDSLKKLFDDMKT